MTQCKSITEDSSRCKRKTLPGRRYCWQHEATLFKSLTIGGIVAFLLALIGLVADLGSLGLPIPTLSVQEFLAPTFEMPPIAIRLVNNTDQDIIVSDLADFSLLVGARVSIGTTVATGRMQLIPVYDAEVEGGSLTVPSRGDLPILGKIRNPTRYREHLENGNSDLELIIYKAGGGIIFSPHPFPFDQDSLQKYRLDIELE